MVGTLPPGDTRLASRPLPGQDLRLSYRSEIDDTEQPYALYVPAGYDGRRPWPLVINLHGTSAGLSLEYVGQTSEHYTADENAAPLWAAERHGALLVTPFGRGITEFRGIGENDVFCAVADVQRRYRVDAERISMTGLSMGGTGSSELALHYPDYFAAAAPIGAAYSFPWLAANGEHLPFWCIGGEHDRNFQQGGRLVADRMERLNFPTRLDIRTGRGHADFVPEYYDGVIAWLVRQRQRRHPSGYSFSAALPLHGQAYWTAIDAIERPGTIGTVHAQIIGANRLHLATDNLTGVAVLPDPAVGELAAQVKPVQVIVDKMRALAPSADIAPVMQQVEDILDDSIVAAGYSIAKESKPYSTDLSQLDVEKLSETFESLRIQTINERFRWNVERKLLKLVQLNPTRTDFAKRFQALIDDYNAGSPNDEELEFLRQLVIFAQGLSKEEQRGVSERLDEEELAIFDLLTKSHINLSDAEREKIKATARDLLATLKSEKLTLDWRKRQQARAEVHVTIKQFLDAGLPQAYTPELFTQKTTAVFEHVYDAYYGAGQSIYAA